MSDDTKTRHRITFGEAKRIVWQIELTCRGCGFQWEYVDDQIAISNEAHPLRWAFGDDPERRGPGRILVLAVPQACPKCLSLRVVTS